MTSSFVITYTTFHDYSLRQSARDSVNCEEVANTAGVPITGAAGNIVLSPAAATEGCSMPTLSQSPPGATKDSPHSPHSHTALHPAAGRVPPVGQRRCSRGLDSHAPPPAYHPAAGRALSGGCLVGWGQWAFLSR